MENLLFIIIGLFGGAVAMFFLKRISGMTGLPPDIKQVLQEQKEREKEIRKKNKQANKEAKEKEKKAREDIENESDKNIVRRFFDAFRKPHRGSGTD
jgi:hypothetical protein